MSPQLSARCVLAVLAAILLASVLGLLAMPPVARVPPTQVAAWLLSSLVPGTVLVASGLGLGWAGSLPRAPGRLAWRAFFGSAALAALLCMLEPVASGVLVWQLSRMATGSACAVVALIFLAERLGRGWIRPTALGFGLLAGPIAAAIGLLCSAVHGHPDERLLLWLECSPLLLLPLSVWGLPTRGLPDGDWLIALGFFGLARLFEMFATQLAARSPLNGTMLSQLALAASVGWLACAIGRQLSDAGEARSSRRLEGDRGGEGDALAGLAADPRESAASSSAQTAG